MTAPSFGSWLETTALAELGMILVASSLLCIAGWLLSSLFRRRSAAVRFGVWQLAICGIVLSTLLIVTTDGVPLGLAPIARRSGGGAVAAGSTSGRVTPQPAETIATRSAEDSGHDSPVAGPASATFRRVADYLKTGVSVVWLAFSGLMLSRMALSALNAQRLVRTSRKVECQRIVDALQVARERIGLGATRKVQLRQTDELSVPFTIGILRPAVVIPSAASEWSTAKLEMVLAHEVAHVLRRDVLFHWLSRLSCCLAGINPLTWLAQRHCVFERERACDDRVLAAGYRATDYGQSLLEVAAAMGGRNSLPAAGVSMAYPHFRRRMETLLAKEVDRRPMSKYWIGSLLVLFVALTIAAGALRPFDAMIVADDKPTAAVIKPPQSNPVPKTSGKPGWTQGTVTDEAGQPIAGASVDVHLVNSAGGAPYRTWSVKGDEQGRFEIETGPVDALPDNAELFVTRASADGFAAEMGRWMLSKQELATEDLRPTVLMRANKVVGRVVDADDHPVTGLIYAAGTAGDPNHNWWLDGVKIAANGRFELYVPRGWEIELLVFGADHAPKRVAIESSDSKVLDIHVARGTRVVGRLLNRKDRPIAGVVIALSSQSPCQIRMAFDAQSATVTDAEGRFTLPPASGRCQVWAATAAASMEKSREPITGAAPPPSLPILVDLAADSAAEYAVTLKEAETVTISGTARWENGDPVANFEVKGGTGELSDVVLQSVKTDGQGKYQMTIPQPLSHFYLMAFGAKNSDGVWMMAHGQCKGAKSADRQFITFNDLTTDQSGADWVLKPFQNQPRP